MSESQMPFDDADELYGIATQARESKENICRDGPRDLIPAVFWFSRWLGYQPSVMMIDDLKDKDKTIVDALPEIMLMLYNRGGPPRMVVLATDSWMYRETQIGECLRLDGLRLAGPGEGEYNGRIGGYSITLPYRFVGGAMEWGEYLVDGTTGDPAIYNALHIGFAIEAS